MCDVCNPNENYNVYFKKLQKYYFKVLHILNSTHFFITKIPNKRELQQIALNHSSDIDFKDFIKIDKKMYCRTMFFSSY